jgi:hypothetical protein
VDQDQRWIATAARSCNYGAAPLYGDNRSVRRSASGEQLLWSRLRARWEIDQEGEESNHK